MFKRFMGKSTTTRGDVILAVGGAIISAWKALDTYREYQEDKKEN